MIKYKVKVDMTLAEKLLDIMDKASALEASVIDVMLSHDDIECFIKDVIEHGCQGGIVSELVYYYQTHAFYNELSDEIDQLKEEVEENMGEPLRIIGDVRNFLAWFAFEEITRRIANKIGLNI